MTLYAKPLKGHKSLLCFHFTMKLSGSQAYLSHLRFCYVQNNKKLSPEISSPMTVSCNSLLQLLFYRNPQLCHIGIVSITVHDMVLQRILSGCISIHLTGNLDPLI